MTLGARMIKVPGPAGREMDIEVRCGGEGPDLLFQHGAGGVDVELGAVHFVHFHAAKSHANHLGVTEILRAVRGERHGAAHGRHQAEVDQVRRALMHNDVVGLDVRT